MECEDLCIGVKDLYKFSPSHLGLIGDEFIRGQVFNVGWMRGTTPLVYDNSLSPVQLKEGR
jgi:hypothetical protein